MKISPPFFPRSWLVAANDPAGACKGAADRIVISPDGILRAGDLGESDRGRIFLRLEDESAGDALALLQKAAEAKLAGIVLAGSCKLADMQRLATLLSVAEAKAADEPERMTIVALAGDDAASLLGAGLLAGGCGRLLALAGGGERSDAARGLLVLAAAAARVPALAGPGGSLSSEIFEDACRRDMMDGFAGRFVENDAQATIVNRLFGSQGAGGR